jgi:Leucine-rich repeat (LRR) protein
LKLARAASLGLLLAAAAVGQIDLASHLRLDGTQLDLRGVPVTDSDLAVLAEPAFSSVQDVLLTRSAITNAGLVYLRYLRVSHLDLFGTQISDAGLQLLRGLPLRGLVLSGTSITDNGLKELAILSLQTLVLSDTAVTGRGLAELKDLPIRVLDLSHCLLEDRDVAVLRSFQKLETLDLSFTRISNNALMDLKEIAALKDLYLLGTEISGRPIEEFHSARPDVRVSIGLSTR